MSEYAKNIQKIEDIWKKRIKLQDKGVGQMSEYIYASNGEPLLNEYGEIALARHEVVRCRDCEYYEPNTYSHFTCELLQFHVEPDGFCAWGERREP